MQRRFRGIMPTHSEEQHCEAARLALANAQDIANNVRLLLDHRRSARGLALAVIGAEEAGKALLHTFAALGIADRVVKAFEERSQNSPLLNHLFKQFTVEMIGGADDELDSYEMAAAGEVGPYPPVERTARILLGCGKTLADAFEEREGVWSGRAPTRSAHVNFGMLQGGRHGGVVGMRDADADGVARIAVDYVTAVERAAVEELPPAGLTRYEADILVAQLQEHTDSDLLAHWAELRQEATLQEILSMLVFSGREEREFLVHKLVG